VNLLAIGVAIWSLLDSRLQYEERSVVDTENLSLVLERYLAGVMEKVDLTLLSVIDELEHQIEMGRSDPDRLNAHMTRQLSRLPELDGIRMADPQGVVVYGTGMPLGSRRTVADRDYFVYLRDHPKAGLTVSKPLLGRVSGKLVIVVARRINLPDGSFGGVVYGAISLNYFTKVFSTISVGPHGAITLTDLYRDVISRSTLGDEPTKYLGKKVGLGEGLKKLLEEGKTVGTYRAESALDHVLRTFTFRRIDGYPLIIFVGKAPSDYLQQWRWEAAKIGGLIALLTLISTISSWQIYQRRKREMLAETELYQYKNYLEGMVQQRTGELETRNRELQESEGVLTTIFHNVYDAIVIHDAKGRILQVNRRWLEMYKVTEEESVRLTIVDFSMNPPPAEELDRMWGNVLAGSCDFFEWRARRPHDGSQFLVEAFLCPIRLREQDLIMGCVRDITERKAIMEELQRYRNHLELLVQERAEEVARAVEETQRETEQRIAAVEELRHKERLLIQQSRLAAMGEMMGNIAHQWRQPLNILGLIIQELRIYYQRGALDDELVNSLVPKAMQVIAHMSQTIDDFRNLLSPDKAKTIFSINEVIEKVLSMMQLQAKVEVVAEEEVFAEGARNEYSQVIINILANANDVFRERQVQEPHITLRLQRLGSRSVVSIADNGGGIPEEIMCKIFDPYFTTKAPDKGTGIGLFMSKTIIEQSMKGTLSAHNTSEGAEFRIEVDSRTPPSTE
jgi:PAS domain S-box-containing protein